MDIVINKRRNDLRTLQYDDIFHSVLESYHYDFRAEREHSYDYKLQSGRVKNYSNRISTILGKSPCGIF